MSVTLDDVRHVAALARLGIDSERAVTLVGELNGILGHMDVLVRVDTAGIADAEATPDLVLPLRVDSGPPLSLARPLTSFGAEVRDGFLLVPRLETHEDAGS